MRVIVYDVDDKEHLNDLKKQEFIGSAEFMMHSLITAKDQILTLDLMDKKKTGVVIMQVEQIDKKLSSDVLNVTIEGTEIKKSGTYFYKLQRSEKSSFLPVYQSETRKVKNECCNWKKVVIPTASLYRDDEEKPIQIELYEYSSRGNHKLIDNQTFKMLDIRDNYVWHNKIGKLRFNDASVMHRDTFLDYLFGGCQISLAIAIDFTASNGSPDSNSSLHCNNLATNQYIQVINSIGGILQEYDADKLIPVLGFGAQVPAISGTSHCFALNGNIFGPEVYGIDGVLGLYQKNLNRIRFSGPTFFAPIIKYMGDIAEWHVSNGLIHNYFVLLIITDGIINDMEATKDEIVRCSGLPVSIIIAGVGDSDFSSMEELDGDYEPLYSSKLGMKAHRDIVQFVEFNKYAHNLQNLTKETLAELPGQLVDYMSTKKIPPVSPIVVPIGPNFYESRKNEFVNSFAPSGQAQNALNLLQVGYPVDNKTEFERALAVGYQNILSAP